VPVPAGVADVEASGPGPGASEVDIGGDAKRPSRAGRRRVDRFAAVSDTEHPGTRRSPREGVTEGPAIGRTGRPLAGDSGHTALSRACPNALSRRGDADAVVAAYDELAHGVAGCFLHRDAFCVGAFAWSCSFVIGQGSCHTRMSSPRCRASPPRFGGSAWQRTSRRADVGVRHRSCLPR
jgi:hypothetical protein